MDEHIKKHWESEGVIFNEIIIDGSNVKDYFKIFNNFLVFNTQIPNLEKEYIKNYTKEDIYVFVKKWKEQIFLKIFCIFLKLDEKKYIKPNDEFFDFINSDASIYNIEITSILENRVHKYIKDYKIY